jgi:Kef-type K+ transport system membrane component KefB
MALSDASLPYHEPGIVTILVYSSFLLLLNAINYILDRLVYCGLIGQIFLGIAWGSPGGKWLPIDAQNTIVSLGYIGLILLVYEGGLATNLRSLKANLGLSVLVAVVGITVPIGLSFVLQAILGITPVQAFAAGAALCSTSLGTTFTVLTTSGLSESRLGVVLTSAAMLDDVVGLVMVQVISNLGSPSFSASTVIHPVGVSVAFTVIIPCICLFLVKPLAGKLLHEGTSHLPQFLRTPEAAFIMQTLLLLVFVTGSSYAGTSNLFAAYLAGTCMTWFDDLDSQSSKQMTPDTVRVQNNSESLTSEQVADQPLEQAQSKPSSRPEEETPPDSAPTAAGNDSLSKQEEVTNCTGRQVFNDYYLPVLSTILKPLFFASIGFSIPISKMFGGQVVWRGFVYAFLMTFGKLLCGACLIRFSVPSLGFLTTWRKVTTFLKRLVSKEKKVTPVEPPQPTADVQGPQCKLSKPLSLYPAAILGSAMVSRGEIGFLISAVAESNGIFASSTGEGSALFLVVTWAILLCTVLGPITVGLLVKRVRRLQATEREQNTGKADPLGIWGIVEHA